MGGSERRRARSSRWVALALAVLTVTLTVAPAWAGVPVAQAAQVRSPQDATVGATGSAEASATSSEAASTPEAKSGEPTSTTASPQVTTSAARAAAPADESVAAPSGTPGTADPATVAPSATASGTPDASRTSAADQQPAPAGNSASAQAPAPAATSAPASSEAPAASVGPHPTITSDLADYGPGDTVTLLGAGWQPGEVVTIVVNDTGGLTWSLKQDVVAGADGQIEFSFVLPAYYVPSYDVTATGAVSGIATAIFTDAASGTWRYWISTVTPANNGSVASGGTVTYVLNAQRTGGTSSFTNATVTFTLTGDATFTAPTGTLGTNLGTLTGVGAKTLVWTGMTLNGTNTRSITVTATVASAAEAGTLTTLMGDNSDANGSWYSAGGLQATSHTVAGPVSNTCDFADAGSGAYAGSICWFDLTGYDSAIAGSVGQTMRQSLPGGYTLTYLIKVGSSDAAAAAKTLPTWTGSYLGNTNSGVGGYYGISGMPAIYQSAGGTTTLALSNIKLTDSVGTTVSGFALVGADAESTDDNESITWTSSAAFTSIGPLGNACGGGFTGAGTTTVKCTGGTGVGSKTGTAILYSKDPTTFTQSMVGSGLQGVAFGVMVSGVQLIKSVVNPVTASDGFSISVASGGTTLSTKTANAASAWKADTGAVYWIIGGSTQSFTMSETAISPTNAANYAVSWACTKNGVAYTPTGSSDTTKTVTLTTFADFIVCTITNTGPAVTVRKTTTGAAGGPFGFTLTNTTQASGSVTTTAAGTATQVDGDTSTSGTQPFAVSTVGTAVTVTETVLTGWRLASAKCVNASSTVVGSLTGSVYTIPAASVVAGAAITCDFTNERIAPTITVRKTTTGLAGGPFSFTLTNTTQTSGTVTTSTAGTPVQAGTFTMSSFGTAVTITEGSLTGWLLSGASCTNASSTVVGSLSGSVYTIPVAALPAGAVITCDFTNRPLAGTVTWTKVDAGSTATLLSGSEWTLTGPSYPAPGTTVTDCVQASVLFCTGLDKDPAAGSFAVTALAYGTYSLVEKTAPVGFQLDTTARPFSVTTDASTVTIGAIQNKRVPVPAIPLTGGPSTDGFLFTGAALLALAAAAAWRQRRRVQHPRT